MNSFCIRSFKGLGFAGLCCVLSGPLHAWEPSAKELDGAISSGDFTSNENMSEPARKRSNIRAAG